MNYRIVFILTFCIFFSSALLGGYVSPKEAEIIGQKIWKNECGGKRDGLTSWNEGEAFASLGIGHFIWYPKDKKGVFKETFPSLVVFLERHGKKVPAGILKKGSKACPWESREDFLKNFSSKPMQDLRNFLADTIDLQTTFIIQRLNQALPTMLKSLPLAQHEQIKKQFYRIAQSPGGFYALIDYINFKGEGIVAHEQYKGCRWGLLQVLEKMKGAAPGSAALQEFSRCAQEVLETRIAYAPIESNEKRWMPGWLNRLKTYVP